MCEDSYGDARERTEKIAMHEGEQQRILYALVEALEAAKGALLAAAGDTRIPVKYADKFIRISNQIDAALALARSDRGEQNADD